MLSCRKRGKVPNVEFTEVKYKRKRRWGLRNIRMNGQHFGMEGILRTSEKNDQ
jgi:hypothetical protein